MEIFPIADNCKFVSKIDPRPLVSFSCGVDSIAMWLRLKELADQDSGFNLSDASFFYMYYIPGLPFVDDYISYFEQKEGIKIAQVPHNLFLEALANWHFQSPSKSKAIELMQKTKDKYVLVSKSEIEDYVKKRFGYSPDAYTCVGVKAGDSAMRRMAMRKTQGINHTKKKLYPIADMENRDVYDIIKRHGIKVPVDYDLFGISYENLQYRFAKVISEQCPESWKICQDWFPDIGLSLARYDRFKPEWCGDGMIKGRKGKIFHDMVLTPRMAL
jgi:3'-phosphoadenosine 5'-phosphosulfate sulfotransferase (PAPS reductase)/FAD synthetase